MIKQYTIYGERCSGTNYLIRLMEQNFDICNVTHDLEMSNENNWNYGNKHFFGLYEDKLKESDNTLFICIVRNPVDWLNSLYKNPWHICNEIRGNVNKFLNDEFYSYNDACGPRYGTEIMQDRNMYTGERYKNIFELRHTKLKFMIEDLPNLVKHYVFIKHEDLVNDFENTMNKIKDTGLCVKPQIKFPLNWIFYKDLKEEIYKKKEYKEISKDLILKSPHLIEEYEKKLGYL